jgi:hypothetical protein
VIEDLDRPNRRRLLDCAHPIESIGRGGGDFLVRYRASPQGSMASFLVR